MNQATLFKGPYFETLAEARTRLEDDQEKGAICPCCGQFSKIYTRKLNSGMAYSLLRIARAFPNGEWVHVERFSKSDTRAAEFSKLRFWGLVEPKGERKEDGNSAGYWRVTQKGYAFVGLKTLIPAKAQIYNNGCRGFSDQQINIIQALGKRFNYYELMGDRL